MIKITKKPTSDELSLELYTGTSIANAIRRIIIANIPIYAFNHFNIKKNTSRLNNDFISHRIGLVPLSDEVTEDIEFTLEKKCDSGRIFVTSSDIKSSDNKDYIQPNVLLLQLFEEEEIDMKIKVSKGIAKENAKWSPVNVVRYQYKVDEKEAKKIKMIDGKPNRTFDNDRQRIYMKNKDKTPIICMEIEGNGMRSTSKVFKKAILILKEKLIELKKDTEASNDNKISIIQDDIHNTLVDILIRNENHTLGNLLKIEIAGMKGIDFCGYKMPHPLKEEVLIKLKTDLDHKEVFIKAISNLIKTFDTMLDEFKQQRKKYKTK